MCTFSFGRRGAHSWATAESSRPARGKLPACPGKVWAVSLFVSGLDVWGPPIHPFGPILLETPMAQGTITKSDPGSTAESSRPARSDIHNDGCWIHCKYDTFNQSNKTNAGLIVKTTLFATLGAKFIVETTVFVTILRKTLREIEV